MRKSNLHAVFYYLGALNSIYVHTFHYFFHLIFSDIHLYSIQISTAISKALARIFMVLSLSFASWNLVLPMPWSLVILLLCGWHPSRIPNLFIIEPICSWNVPVISLIFLKRSRLSHSVVFLYFFALIAEEAFLISPCYSLELCIQMLSFLINQQIKHL